MGTINPCTRSIQFEDQPAPGYAKNVMLLIRVARIDIPTAQAGIEPWAVKNFLILFWFLENFKLIRMGIIREPPIIK